MGVCARGDVCPGHRLPSDSRGAAFAFVCCVECGALCGTGRDALIVVGVREAVATDAGAGWKCRAPFAPCAGPTTPSPAGPPAPRAATPPRRGGGGHPRRHPAFATIEQAASNGLVREALGLAPGNKRAHWVGLRADEYADGSRAIVGVCHAHFTPRGRPGHDTSLHTLADATRAAAGAA